MLVEVGITTPEILRQIGPEEAYRRLRFAHGRRVTVNFIYALDVAITDGRWDEMNSGAPAKAQSGRQSDPA